MDIDLTKIAKFFLRVAVLAVVIVMPTTFFPFIGGKYYFFRVAVELALAAGIVWWGFFAKDGEFTDRLRVVFKNPLVLAVTAFAVSYLLASLFANDPRAAFWSNFERGEGGFQMLHYYFFFLACVFFFKTEEDWDGIFKYSLWAGVLMILYGVFAAALISGFVGPYQNTEGVPLLKKLFSLSRFQGSLGNPAYVAPYLSFSMFYVLWLWAKGKKTLFTNVIYGALIALFGTFFILSQTRGAFVGLVAAVVLGLVYYIWAVGSPRLRKTGGVVLLLVTALLGIMFYFRNAPFVAQIPGGRLLTISTSEQTFKTRFWTWGSAWRGFKEHPILGWGPENFSTVFDKYFDPRHYVPGLNSETWFDRAHSIIFDYLAETGILGFFSFLSIFVVFYVRFFKKFHSKEKEEGGAHHGLSPFLKMLLFSVLIAYGVQGLALFDVLPTYLNLFLVLAFGAYQLAPHKNHAA